MFDRQVMVRVRVRSEELRAQQTEGHWREQVLAAGFIDYECGKEGSNLNDSRDDHG